MNTKKAAKGDRAKLATVNDLADYVGVPVQTIYEWNCRGTGPKVLKVGRYVRYRWSDIDRWLDSTEKGDASYAPPS
jgi:predicted DNA-binding transcriptional regulator AlpA